MLRLISVLTLGTAFCFILKPQGRGADMPDPALRTQIRRPVDLIVQGDRLIVGNSKSGSITVIDAGTGRILAEHQVAQRIADIAPLPGTNHLLVLDDRQKQLLKVTWAGGGADSECLETLPAAGDKLAVDEKHHRIDIACKWAHRVIRLTMDENHSRVLRRDTIELPFAPLELLHLPSGDKLLVAEAFGNRLAVLGADGKLLKMHEIDGHNIRGLTLSQDGKSVLIAHQQIPDKAVASYDGLHWGRIVTNAVQVLDASKLLSADTPKDAEGWLNTFGDVGNAAADPSEVITGDNGLVAVAFTGGGEVSISYKKSTRRVPVQTGPEAMAVWRETLFVANRLEDSISVIDLKEGKVRQTISLGPAPTLTSEQRGEKLFFNARLSHDGWLSCHSCHSEGHTTGLVVDTLGDGDYGAPKLVPSLLGTRDTQPWAWNGSLELLRAQIQQSMMTTMHGEPLSARDMEDMFAYITSLDPPPPPRSFPNEHNDQRKQIFEKQGCISCHAPPAYTTPETVEVSLLDEQGRSRFNPPSLRGVSHRRRFFHDGRAKSLEDVVLKIRHQQEEPISKKDAEALLAFLRSL